MDHKLVSHSLNRHLKLYDHIDQVIKASKYLVSQKSLNFNGLSKQQIEELSIIVAASHDFGKSTSFFQIYIKNPTGNSDTKEKSHALISAFLGYHITEKWALKNELEEHWIKFLPFSVFAAIEAHHGIYKSLDEVLKSINKSKDLMEKQIDNVIQEIYEYKFFDIDLSEGMDFNIQTIEEISSKLRKLNIIYKKIPKGYDRNEWQETQIEHRLLALFLYSILLESDKAYLASDDPKQYEREPIPIPDDLVDIYLTKLEGGKLINEERNKAFEETIRNVNSFPLTERLHSITLPTGLGKTLLSASWAIKLRSRIKKENRFTPKIIVSLPFLSIIEQTNQTYKKFLDELYIKHKERLYLASYSIADFEYRDGGDELERSDNSIDFFLNIWNAEIVVSTFDQLLYSLFSLRSKYLMRFHNLFNSIIIFDEVQALPSELWRLFETFFKKLSEVGNTHVLLMSATQPGFLPGAIERVPNHEVYFKNRKRVELHVSPEKKQLKTFIEDLPDFINSHINSSIMIVLNTRGASKSVLKELKTIHESIKDARPLFYLSSLVAPSQRSRRILEIKRSLDNNEKPLIVTTQCIEAGVDIDVDYIARDWAPMDSIFQVCGRCNRNGEKEVGIVDIFTLESDKGKKFSEMIYDNIKLQSTANSLGGLGLKVYETQFYGLGTKYFKLVRIREHSGQSMEIVNAYAQYTHTYKEKGKDLAVDIKRLLRDDKYQEQFIISSLDVDLKDDIRKAMAIEDRWQRRYAVKRLRKRISANSVSIRFPPWSPVKPDDLAIDKIGNFRILNAQFYDATDSDGVGFNVDLGSPVGGNITISWDESNGNHDL
jgi:CRISPR-associated endonuclease/helicase Cas3